MSLHHWITPAELKSQQRNDITLKPFFLDWQWIRLNYLSRTNKPRTPLLTIWSYNWIQLLTLHLRHQDLNRCWIASNCSSEPWCGQIVYTALGFWTVELVRDPSNWHWSALSGEWRQLAQTEDTLSLCRLTRRLHTDNKHLLHVNSVLIPMMVWGCFCCVNLYFDGGIAVLACIPVLLLFYAFLLSPNSRYVFLHSSLQFSPKRAVFDPDRKSTRLNSSHL